MSWSFIFCLQLFVILIFFIYSCLWFWYFYLQLFVILMFLSIAVCDCYVFVYSCVWFRYIFLFIAVCDSDILIYSCLLFWYFCLKLFVILIFLSTAICYSDICCNRWRDLLASGWWLPVRNSKQVNPYTIMHAPPPPHTHKNTCMHVSFCFGSVLLLSNTWLFCHLFCVRAMSYLNIFPSIPISLDKVNFPSLIFFSEWVLSSSSSWTKCLGICRLWSSSLKRGPFSCKKSYTVKYIYSNE